MMDLFRSLFGESRPAEPSDAAQLATAALLVEAAFTDGTLAESEQALIDRLLAEHFGLSQAAALNLRTRAIALQKDSSQLFPLTRTLVTQCDGAQRIALLEMLWAVAYADGTLHDYEASLVRRLAGLLYVSDQDSGRVRRRVLERLGLEPPRTP